MALNRARRVAAAVLVGLSPMVGVLSARADLPATRASYSRSFIGATPPCSFVMGWAKEPATGRTRSLSLSLNSSCAATVHYAATLTLNDQNAGARSVATRAANDTNGSLTASMRYPDPGSLHLYEFVAHIYFEGDPTSFDGYPKQCSENPGSQPDPLTGGGVTIPPYYECVFAENIFVQNGVGALAAVRSLVYDCLASGTWTADSAAERPLEIGAAWDWDVSGAGTCTDGRGEAFATTLRGTGRYDENQGFVVEGFALNVDLGLYDASNGRSRSFGQRWKTLIQSNSAAQTFVVMSKFTQLGEVKPLVPVGTGIFSPRKADMPCCGPAPFRVHWLFVAVP